MTSSLIVGASSEIAQWIKSALDSIGSKYILISRNIKDSDYSVSDYTNIEEIINILNALYAKQVVLNSIYFCPGSYAKAKLKCSDPTEWIKDISINLNSAYVMYRSLSHTEYIKSKIKLIYIGSTATISKPQGFSSYAIAKGALEDLVTYINNEPPSEIRSTCLRLGTCQTSFAHSTDTKNVLIKEDIINCIKFLESSRHITLPDLISMRPIKEQ